MRRYVPTLLTLGLLLSGGAAWAQASQLPAVPYQDGWGGSSGDFNGDGRVDSLDLTLLGGILTGQNPPTTTGDLDGDFEVTSGDLDRALSIIGGATPEVFSYSYSSNPSAAPPHDGPMQCGLAVFLRGQNFRPDSQVWLYGRPAPSTPVPTGFPSREEPAFIRLGGGGCASGSVTYWNSQTLILWVGSQDCSCPGGELLASGDLYAVNPTTPGALGRSHGFSIRLAERRALPNGDIQLWDTDIPLRTVTFEAYPDLRDIQHQLDDGDLTFRHGIQVGRDLGATQGYSCDLITQHRPALLYGHAGGGFGGDGVTTSPGAFSSPAEREELLPGALPIDISSSFTFGLGSDATWDASTARTMAQGVGAGGRVALSEGERHDFMQVDARPENFPVAVLQADLNDDGLLDHAYATLSTQFPFGGNAEVVIRIAQAPQQGPSFAPDIRFALGDFNTTEMTFADLEGDGRPELLVVGRDGQGIGRLQVIGNQGGTFQAPVVVQHPFFTFIQALASGDFDGDGAVDVALLASFAYNGDGVVYVLYNDGAGSLSPSPGQRSWVDVGQGPVDLGAADLDRNGVDDLVALVKANGEQVWAILDDDLRTSNPLDPQVVALRDGTYPDALTLGDFTGEGYPDVAIVNGGARYVGCDLSGDYAVGSEGLLFTAPPGAIRPLQNGVPMDPSLLEPRTGCFPVCKTGGGSGGEGGGGSTPLWWNQVGTDADSVSVLFADADGWLQRSWPVEVIDMP